jgi:hypothetical protein
VLVVVDTAIHSIPGAQECKENRNIQIVVKTKDNGDADFLHIASGIAGARDANAMENASLLPA